MCNDNGNISSQGRVLIVEPLPLLPSAGDLHCFRQLSCWRRPCGVYATFWIMCLVAINVLWLPQDYLANAVTKRNALPKLSSGFLVTLIKCPLRSPLESRFIRPCCVHVYGQGTQQSWPRTRKRNKGQRKKRRELREGRTEKNKRQTALHAFSSGL